MSVLTLDEYQTRTGKTAVYPQEDLDGVFYTTMGLAGEAGEIANNVKKIMRDDTFVLTQERREKLLDELGDVLYYVSELATQLGSPLENVALRNIVKLAQRAERGTLRGSGDKR